MGEHSQEGLHGVRSYGTVIEHIYWSLEEEHEFEISDLDGEIYATLVVTCADPNCVHEDALLPLVQQIEYSMGLAPPIITKRNER